MTTQTTGTWRQVLVQRIMEAHAAERPVLLPRCVWCGERTAPGRFLCPDCQAIPPRAER